MILQPLSCAQIVSGIPPSIVTGAEDLAIGIVNDRARIVGIETYVVNRFAV